jgi:hypothetical protein
MGPVCDAVSTPPPDTRRSHRPSVHYVALEALGCLADEPSLTRALLGLVPLVREAVAADIQCRGPALLALAHVLVHMKGTLPPPPPPRGCKGCGAGLHAPCVFPTPLGAVGVDP